MQQTLRTNYLSSDFASSPPKQNSHLKNHFQPTMTYNRLIKNYRPLSSDFYSSHHSNEDLHLKPRLESDFIHPTSLRRSFDVLNDSHVPTNHHHQGTFHNCKSSLTGIL